MIVYHIFDSEGKNFIFETSDIEAAMECADYGLEVVIRPEVTSISSKNDNNMWSDYQI